jgi:predicted DNA-binding transcriptional regulator AlpA
MLHRPKQDLFTLAADIAALKQQLSRVTDALARLAEGDRRVSLTIAEWCARHGLSESQYHKLRKQNRAPRALKIGSAGLRISIEADADWVRDREAEAAEKQTPAQRIA